MLPKWHARQIPIVLSVLWIKRDFEVKIEKQEGIMQKYIFMQPRDYYDRHRWKQLLAYHANAA